VSGTDPTKTVIVGAELFLSGTNTNGWYNFNSVS
jgi:hypothetical protein